MVWAGAGSDDGLMAVQLLLPLPLPLLLLLLLLLLLTVTVRESQLPAPTESPIAAAAALLSIVCAAQVATAAASLPSNRSSICCSRCLARLRCRGAEERGWSLHSASHGAGDERMESVDSMSQSRRRQSIVTECIVMKKYHLRDRQTDRQRTNFSLYLHML
jgi:hypothetical protein